MGLKYSVDEEFFDSWSDGMAYVLGYIYADGNLMDSPSIRGKYVRITSTDKDRIELIKALMQSDHTIWRYSDGRRKDRYHLSIGNARLYAGLIARGVTPRKSLTIQLPPVPRKYLAAFALGYFDGDGCAFIERNPKGAVRCLLSIYTSGSRAFLEALHTSLVEEIGIKGGGLRRHGSTDGIFQLRYSTRDSLRLFTFLYSSKELIGLALKRKYAIFSEYVSMRGITPDNLPRILLQKGPVVKQ